MPRLTRLDTPGVLHHVTGRGIERSDIFIDNKDRKIFINRLSWLVKEGAIEVYALCFTDSGTWTGIFRRGGYQDSRRYKFLCNTVYIIGREA